MPTRSPALVALGALATLLLAVPARAHIEVEPTSAVAGEFAYLRFLVYHGCQGAATNKVTIKIPDGVTLVRPQVKTGWTIQTVSAPYKEPIDAGREKITEGFVEITWEGGPLPKEYTDDFSIVARMPYQPGEDATFLARQFCVDKPAPEEFAPGVHLVAPAGDAAAEGGGKAEAQGDGVLPVVSVVLAGIALLVSLGAWLAARRRQVP
jgi:uncharacterized protein YcnI